MKYISKTNDKSANPIIDAYLSFAKAQPWYSSIELYNGFWGSRGKHRLIDDVLIKEQDGLCCYCQMHMTGHLDTNVTIEHIVRQHTPDRASMLRYFKPQFIGLNSNNECFTEDYVNGKSRVGQYPHKVAYHNFAIACKRCNNARGHNEIDPIFLYPTIEAEVYYDHSTGELTWLTDPMEIEDAPTERPTVEKVNLNSSLLRAIRTVWFYGKSHPQKNYSTPDTITAESQKRELVYSAFGEALANNNNFEMEDLNVYMSILTPALWDLTLRYSYFG